MDCMDRKVLYSLQQHQWANEGNNGSLSIGSFEILVESGENNGWTWIGC